MPTATDRLLRSALDRATPVLDRFGAVGAPLRHVFEARQAITIDAAPEDVARRLADRDDARTLFGSDAAPEPGAGGTTTQVRMSLGRRGRAEARLRPLGEARCEVVLEVHLERVVGAGTRRPRYADNAGVVATRAVHRLKSLVEAGEAPTLAHNPAARPDPDPYGD